MTGIRLANENIRPSQDLPSEHAQPIQQKRAATSSSSHGATMTLQWRLAAIEFMLINAACMAAWWVVPLASNFSWIWPPVVSTGVIFCIQTCNGYGLDRLIEPRRAIGALFCSYLTLFLCLTWMQWGLKAPELMAALSLGCLAGGCVLAMFSMRHIYAIWIAHQSKAGLLTRQVGVISCGTVIENGQTVDQRLRQEISLPPKLHDFTFEHSKTAFQTSEHYTEIQSSALRLQAFKRADVLAKQLARVDLDEIILVVEGAKRTEDVCLDVALGELLKVLEMLPLRTRLILPDETEGLRLAKLLNPPLDHASILLKRTVDISLSAFLLLVLSPIMLLIAVLIRIESKGSVFFTQQRFGYRNTIFELWKFRSMYTEMCDANAAQLTSRGDPRVTRIGAFIRRSSIDELPQLFNVLKGDMSLVGPRPHPMSAKAGDRFYEDVVERFGRRYRVKPGLTGLAQVSGLRGNTDTEDKLIKRFEADLDYVRHWSLHRDLIILIKTPWISFTGENAF